MTQQLNRNKKHVERRLELVILLKVLHALKKMPTKKYTIMCMLTTNTSTLNRTLNTLLAYDLIYRIGDNYDITGRGLELLRLLDGVNKE